MSRNKKEKEKGNVQEKGKANILCVSWEDVGATGAQQREHSFCLGSGPNAEKQGSRVQKMS